MASISVPAAPEVILGGREIGARSIAQLPYPLPAPYDSRRDARKDVLDQRPVLEALQRLVDAAHARGAAAAEDQRGGAHQPPM